MLKQNVHGSCVLGINHAWQCRSSNRLGFVPHSERPILARKSDARLRMTGDHPLVLRQPCLVLFRWGNLDMLAFCRPLEFSDPDQRRCVRPSLLDPIITLLAVLIPGDLRKRMGEGHVPDRFAVLSGKEHQVLLDRMESPDVPSPGLLLGKAALFDNAILPAAMRFNKDHGRATVGFFSNVSVRILRHTSTADSRVRRRCRRPRRKPSWMRPASR